MKIRFTKNIANCKKDSEVDFDCEQAADIYIRKGFAEKIEPPVLDVNELKAAEVIKLINACETEEDLKIYEGVTKQQAVTAYKKKLAELSE